MKSKNVIILCVWSALTIIFALLMVLGAAYSDNPTQWLIWVSNDFWIASLVAVIFTGAIVFFKKEPELEVHGALQSIVSKLNGLTRDVEVIKKAIED